MATQPAPKRVTTPPKGRPTRSRRGSYQRRTFGSTAQWIAAIAVLLLVLIVVIIVLDDEAGTNIGTSGPAITRTSGVSTAEPSPSVA